MMTKRLMLLLLFALAAFVGSFMLIKNVVLAQERISLIATGTESNYDHSGTITRTQAYFVAIRADGSTVRGRTLSKPGNRGIVEQRSIRDLSSGEEIIVDGLTESIMTTPIKPQHVEIEKRVPKCPIQDSTVRGSMVGYDVIRVVRDRPDPVRFVRFERWLAPALNCLALKEITYSGSTASDLRTASVKEVAKVTLGNPPSVLFEKPVGYPEKSPSQRSQEFYARYPERSCPKCLLETDRLEDENYYRRRNRKD